MTRTRVAAWLAALGCVCVTALVGDLMAEDLRSSALSLQVQDSVVVEDGMVESPSNAAASGATRNTDSGTQGFGKPRPVMANVEEGMPASRHWNAGNEGQEGSTGLVFDLSPGTGPPPDTLGEYVMTPFEDDTRPILQDVSDVPSPCPAGGNIELSIPMSHRKIGDGWMSWSHGYTGDVYYTNGAASVTITLPQPACAFYFYVEPNPFYAIDFTAEGSDGTSSGSFFADGSAGAVYVGIFGEGLEWVTISTDDGATDFAIGEFGMACFCGPVYVACCDEATGDCVDSVELLTCIDQGGRWDIDVEFCADLDPPCGSQIGACCCGPENEPGVCEAYECIADMTNSACLAAGEETFWNPDESCDASPPYDCDAPTYCDGSGGCDEFISNVYLPHASGTIDNTSACTQYGDYTDQEALLLIGMSYDITVTNDHYYSSDVTAVWVDWNGDKDWDDDGEKVMNVDPGGAVASGSFSVPPSAIPGYTRMRIRIDYANPDPDPCGTTTYGEVEDYTVLVSGDVPFGACCDPTTGVCTDDVLATECLPPLQFAMEQLCTDAFSNCGNRGACCYDLSEEGDCIEDVLELDCDGTRHAPAQTCDDFNPDCGDLNFTFVFDPGTGPPPETLCGCPMTEFPDDPRPTLQDVSDVPLPCPTGGDIEFSIPLSHRRIGDGWSTWSHGYTGDVYYSNGATEVTLTLSPVRHTVYFYVEPNSGMEHTFKLTANGAIESEEFTADGLGGAAYAGVCAHCTTYLETITIECTSGADFAIGEFGICCFGPGVCGSCCDPYTGVCNDDVEVMDCLPPLQWMYDVDCAELDPPCGNPGACCDDLLPAPEACEDDVLELNCTGTRFAPLPAMCIDIDPPCGSPAPYFFVFEPGTGPPPDVLCGFLMTAFPLDPRPTITDVSDVPSPCPTGGDIEFSIPLSHRRIGDGWGSWSHGYTGDVYYTNGQTAITLTMPPNSCGFYMYVEPNPFAVHTFKLTVNGVIESDEFTADGEGGAAYAGVCGEGIETITVTCTSSVDFAIGEFGTCCFCGCSPPGACCDPYTGSCTDDITMFDCPAPLQWSPWTLCTELDPPCGEGLGACCVGAAGEPPYDPYECIGDMTAIDCLAIGEETWWNPDESCDASPPYDCGAPTYCEGSGCCDEFIQNVYLPHAGGTIDNSSGCDGYGDYTDQVALLLITMSYDITVTNGNYYSSDVTAVWVDWNGDKDWDDEGEKVMDVDPGGPVATGSFSVPPTAIPGYTRMRIRIDYNNPEPAPCGTTTYGEVEDYSVLISGDVPIGACCDPYTGVCTDEVGAIACLSPLQFTMDTLCADLLPPCGNPGACCDDFEFCVDACEDGILELNCEGTRFAPLPMTCADVEPSCGLWCFFFVFGPGTDPPPETLCGYPMTSFPLDPRPIDEDVVDIPLPCPTGGEIGLSMPLSHRRIGDGWSTWSHGYTGDVYYTNGASEITLTVPPGPCGIYFYVEPNSSSAHTFKLIVNGVIESEEFSAGGSGGAAYAGVCFDYLQTVTVTCTDGMDFAIGEFGVACFCCVYGACCDPYTGDCTDNVMAPDCQPPLQFGYEQTCAELDPPCGNPGCCCDDHFPPEEPPPGEAWPEFQVNCNGRFLPGVLGEDCVGTAFDPECGLYAACPHQIVMWDDYGDGWNSGFIDVYVNGDLVLSGVALDSGTGPETVYFLAGTGSVIQTIWMPGSKPYECSYYIYDPYGTELCSDGVGGVDPTGVTCSGNCETPNGACCLGYDGCEVVPGDDCAIAGGTYLGNFTDCGDLADCDGDGMTDLCAIVAYEAPDCNENGVPDECDPDCNCDGVPDDCEDPPFVPSDPTIDCPEDMTVICGESTDPADTGMATGMDNCGNPAVITYGDEMTLAEPTDLIMYTIARTWTATDECAELSSECVQIITVLKETPSLIIKQDACPAPLNRSSHGVVPMVLTGDVDFDVAQVVQETARLRRADGVGGEVIPSPSAPPGFEFMDINHPYVGEGPCSCNEDQNPDGIMDLQMKFSTDDLVDALLLDALPDGAIVVLVLIGELDSGCEFIATDCVRLVPPAEISPLDDALEPGEFAEFERSYPGEGDREDHLTPH